jgi:hypothetical protein
MWEVGVWFLGYSTVIFLLWLVGIDLTDWLESAPNTGIVAVVVLYTAIDDMLPVLIP